MAGKHLVLAAIAVASVIWAVLVLKFMYPYDKVLSDLGREVQLVFLYDQQRLVDKEELNDELLKADRTWSYGLAENLEVIEVTFPENKKVFFLTTSKGGKAPW